MATNNDDKKIKLSIRTARIQKYITVDEDINVKDVSIINSHRKSHETWFGLTCAIFF